MMSLTIQGLTFSVEPRYSEGHVLSEVEANVLNQTLAENLRNNFAAHIKRKKEAGEELDNAALQSEFADYAAEYVFNGKRTARVVVDPVDREARKMASQCIREALRKRGMDPKTLEEGKMDEMVDGLLAKRPEIREEAQRRINAAKNVAADALDGIV